MHENPKNVPPYTPMSSLGHELGIMFIFLAACFLIIGVYVYFWRAFERREAHRENTRKERLTARRFHNGRGGIHEKLHDNRRVELPAHSRFELSNGREAGVRSTNMNIGVGLSGRGHQGNGWMEMDILGAPRR